MKNNDILLLSVIAGAALLLFQKKATAAIRPVEYFGIPDDERIITYYPGDETRGNVFDDEDAAFVPAATENDFSVTDQDDRGYFQPASAARTDPMVYTNVRAFLDMIAFAEGADYSTLYGGGTFDGFRDHPRQIISARGYKSSAAGRYQFLSSTWDDVSKKIGATSFEPYWQDRAAVYLIKRDGALNDVIAGRFSMAVNKVRKTWASLPGAGYGQTERQYDKLLTAYLNAGGTVMTV